MKRVLSVFLAVLTVLSVFAACGKEEDLGWIVSLDYEQGYSWIYDTDKEGVLTLATREDVPEADGKNGNTMFIFESVGEGEVLVTFSYVTGAGEIKKTVKYSVSVDEDFNYTATLIEDAESTTQAVNLQTQDEAQQYITDYVGIEDKETGNEIIVEFERTYEEDGVIWYAFRTSILVSENGKSYLRFFKLYAVSEFGEIKELPDPDDTADREIDLK